MSETPARSWRGRLGTLLAVLVLAAAAAALLREALFQDRILLAADNLYLFHPWCEAAPAGFAAPANRELLDHAIYNGPWLEWAGARIREGQLPLWNPHNFLGQPFLAANSSRVFWPLSWLYFAWPTWSYFGWAGFAHLFLAGLFTLLLLRRLGCSLPAALAGALSFGLGGFMVTWLHHPLASIAMLVPALLWWVEGLAGRCSRHRVLVLALMLASIFLAGYAQGALHALLLLGAWCLVRRFVPIGGRRLPTRALGGALAAALLAALLAAPQILPMLEYLRDSQAIHHLQREEMVADPPLPQAALLFVDPFLWGAPHHGDYHGPAGHNLTYPDLVGGFVGRIALALALFQLLCGWRDPRSLLFGALALACTLIAWKLPPLYGAMRSLPLLSGTKPARLLLFVSLALAVLAGLGLHRLLQRSGPRWRMVLAAGVPLLVILELMHFGRGFNPALPPRDLYPPTPVTEFLRARPGLHRVLGTEITQLMPQANLPYRISMVTGYDSIERRTTTELVLRLASVEPDFPFVSRIPAFQRPETLPLVSLLNVRYVLARGPVPAPLQLVHDGPLRVYENPGALPRAFLAHGFTVIEDREERLARLSSASFDPYHAILERTPSDPLAARARERGTREGELLELRYEPEQLRIEARLEAPGLLVVSDAWAPGWRCTVNGEERAIERVDHALRGVWLDAGSAMVEMSYEPLSLRAGLWLCLAGLALALLLAVLPLRR